MQQQQQQFAAANQEVEQRQQAQDQQLADMRARAAACAAAAACLCASAGVPLVCAASTCGCTVSIASPHVLPQRFAAAHVNGGDPRACLACVAGWQMACVRQTHAFLRCTLQARMEQRVAERRKRSGRWLGGDAGLGGAGAHAAHQLGQGVEQQQARGQRQPPEWQAAQQQQPSPPGWQGAEQQQQQQWRQPGWPPAEQQAGWQAEQPAAGPEAGGPDLGVFARGGLQRKVARFAEAVNSLRRSQQERGAGVSWGREQAGGGAGAEASRPAGPQPGPAGWEQELGVTRVRRRRGSAAGGPVAADGVGAASQPLPPQGWQQQQQQQQRWVEEQEQRPGQQRQDPAVPRDPPGKACAAGAALPVPAPQDEDGLDW